MTGTGWGTGEEAWGEAEAEGVGEGELTPDGWEANGSRTPATMQPSPTSPTSRARMRPPPRDEGVSGFERAGVAGVGTAGDRLGPIAKRAVAVFSIRISNGPPERRSSWSAEAVDRRVRPVRRRDLGRSAPAAIGCRRHDVMVRAGGAVAVAPRGHRRASGSTGSSRGQPAFFREPLPRDAEVLDA